MRRSHPLLVSVLACALPAFALAPATAQVTVDPNALNALGGQPALPAPPAPLPVRAVHHARPHSVEAPRQPGLTTTARPALAAGSPAQTPPSAPAKSGATKSSSGVAAAASGASSETVSGSGLGPSFTTLPALPKEAPPLPGPPKITLAQPPAAPQPAAPQPAAPHQPIAPKPAAAQPAAPQPAPPAAAPKPATPPPAPAKPAAAPLPPGADLLTLPYSGQETDLPASETTMLRNFVHQYGPKAIYKVEAYATQPEGDDDPSTARRISFGRARAVQGALVSAGAAMGNIRLLARGNAGGTPANRVEVIAIPPAGLHTAPSNSP